MVPSRPSHITHPDVESIICLRDSDSVRRHRCRSVGVVSGGGQSVWFCRCERSAFSVGVSLCVLVHNSTREQSHRRRCSAATVCLIATACLGLLRLLGGWEYHS